MVALRARSPGNRRGLPPESEQRGNYVPSVWQRRYDTFLFCDDTTALQPLHTVEHADTELETYPTGQ